MKIVFISRLYLPHLGGVEIHLREISAILLRMGHNVSIVTSQHDKKLSLHAEYDGVEVFRIPYDVMGNKQKTWNAIKQLRPLFADADVVHVHDVFWWILPIYSSIKNKIFTTFHGWETQFPIPLNSKIHRLFVSKLSKGTIHVGDFIRKFYWDKPNFVTYGGINQKRFTKSQMSKKVVDNKKQKNSVMRFVFVGRLEHDTDIQLYLEFLKVLKANNIVFEVIWVGDGVLKTKCQEFGKVTGFVKNISQYIVKADFVFASSYLSILEAQCLEKIVLAFYSNRLKKEYLETFPGSKYMLIAGSIESMFTKVEQLLSERKLLAQMRLDAKQFALKNTWEKVVGKYLQLWRKR
ncbi:glycosyltransferase family 4 protein [Candidatus Woesebacteria bacterium]|nr:glycosyltransferase family 4 protein [Candidatus Woesebacteria bacterium]